MSKPKEIVPAEGAAALATRADDGNPIAETLRAIVEKGITAENAATLEKVCDLYMKMDAVGARKQYAAAKAALQAELPSVLATEAIPSKDGTIRSTFAPYEEIMAQVRPFLVAHGFSVSFTMQADEKRMKAICTLTHTGGHAETNEFAVRVGSGPPGCSDAQSDGAARSYARRGALCDALNIVIDHDTDARLEGAILSAEAAAVLREKVRAVGEDEARFLRFAGADSFATIRENEVPGLEKELAWFEKQKASGKMPPTPGPAAETPPTPSADRQRLYDLIRAIAASRKMTFDDLWATVVTKAGNLDPGITIQTITDVVTEAFLKMAEKVVAKEKIDPAPYLPGGPEHQELHG